MVAGDAQNVEGGEMVGSGIAVLFARFGRGEGGALADDTAVTD